MIDKRIQNLLDIRERWPEHRFQLLVYSDGSTDRTAAVIQAYADRITPVISLTWVGKSFGMNQMLAQVDCDIVVFTDANVLIDPERFGCVFESFADPEVGCVCGHLVYVNGNESPTARLGSSYWAFEERLKQLETDTGSAIGADGGLFAIRRDLWRPVPIGIIDDFFTSLNILCDGRRVVRDGNFVAYERSAVQPEEEFRRKIRIACRAFNCHRLLWPRLRRLPLVDLYKYVSHRLLRWTGGISLGGLWLSLFVLLLTQYDVVAGAGFVIATILLFRLQRMLPNKGKLSALLLSPSILIAPSIGVLRSLRGERFQTWPVITSARAVCPVGVTMPQENAR